MLRYPHLMNPSLLAFSYLKRIQQQLELPEVAVLLAGGSSLIGMAHTAGFYPQHLTQDWRLEYCRCTENLPWLHYKGSGSAFWVYPIFACGVLCGVVLLCTEHSGFTFDHHRQLRHLCAYEFAACINSSFAG